MPTPYPSKSVAAEICVRVDVDRVGAVVFAQSGRRTICCVHAPLIARSLVLHYMQAPVAPWPGRVTRHVTGARITSLGQGTVARPSEDVEIADDTAPEHSESDLAAKRTSYDRTCGVHARQGLTALRRTVNTQHPASTWIRGKPLFRMACGLLLAFALAACGDGGGSGEAGGGASSSSTGEATETRLTTGGDQTTGGEDGTGGEVTTGGEDGTGGVVTTGGDVTTGTSQAVLRIMGVSLHRSAPSATTCVVDVLIANEGVEPAGDVKVDASVKTVSLPAYGAELQLEGSASIAPGDDETYFRQIPFQFRQGDLLKYDLEVRHNGAIVDTESSTSGIVCSE